MSDPKSDSKQQTELTDKELAGAQGGNSIDRLHPSPRTPTFGPAASIAQGELNSNSTDDNLP